jgi:hypothetical protein
MNSDEEIRKAGLELLAALGLPMDNCAGFVLTSTPTVLEVSTTHYVTSEQLPGLIEVVRNWRFTEVSRAEKDVRWD